MASFPDHKRPVNPHKAKQLPHSFFKTLAAYRPGEVPQVLDICSQHDLSLNGVYTLSTTFTNYVEGTYYPIYTRYKAQVGSSNDGGDLGKKIGPGTESA